jgi:hypothetical protein
MRYRVRQQLEEDTITLLAVSRYFSSSGGAEMQGEQLTCAAP